MHVFSPNIANDKSMTSCMHHWLKSDKTHHRLLTKLMATVSDKAQNGELLRLM